MKKIFTLGIFLAMVLGLGSKAEAATFTSRLSAITGIPVSTSITASNVGLRIGAWNSKATWYDPTLVDTTTVNLPSVTDDVIISAGDSIYINGLSYCGTLKVNGVVCTNNAILNVNGDATVGTKGSTTGILSIIKQVYCKNLYNYGKTWSPTKTNSNSTTTVALYIGYTCSGATATASTDDCTLLNDGVVGWYRTAAAGGVAKGCGLFIYYPNTIRNVNITHSPDVTSGYVLTVVGIQPVNAGTQSQNLNLNINESLAVVSTTSSIPFALHNNETFPSNYTRTCTIANGDTVFVAGYFHRNSAPSVTQGPMIYNVYGCLDLGTYRQTKNEFDIYTNATLSSPITINIGDGTQANAGTLVFGAAINLSQGAANQIIINPNTYSTVKFGYKAAPTISCLTATVADNNLFPSSLYNLTMNNTGAVTLPTGINVNVSNTLNLTLGTIALGTTNLTANSISGGSSTSYVATTGTGVLKVASAAGTATLLPIGASATSYDPVTVNATSASNITAKVSATLSGTQSAGIYTNAKEWTLTSSIPSSTLVTFKPAIEDTNVTSTLSTSAYNALIGVATGSATYTNYNAAYSGGAYSATFSTLGSFVTGANSLATALTNNSNKSLSVFASNKSVMVQNAKAGDLVTVFGVNGVKVASSVLSSDNATLPLSTGIYMVKVGSTTTKVAVF